MNPSKAYLLKRVASLAPVLCALLLSSCASKKAFTLMPTPVLYRHSGLDPFEHLPPAHRSTRSMVFYATTRAESKKAPDLSYGNRVDKTLHLGVATIQMGNPGEQWKDLHQASLKNEREQVVPVILEKVEELATLPAGKVVHSTKLSPELQAFVDPINKELATALDPEIMIYVHGTKVDFANSVLLTAEIDHFAGRDFVGIGFAWPSHQNIIKYFTGTDVKRALHASGALKQLIELLAQHTQAEKINILSYSAGGKVATKALFDLRQEHAGLEAKAVKKKFRLGAVVFAAADVEMEVFFKRAKATSELSTHVALTLSDEDNVLLFAEKYMGGGFRIGSEEALVEEEAFILKNHLDNVEVIDVSAGKSARGFDIIGHHYWYRYPWISSDIIFMMRTGLPASRRGLSAAEMAGVWSLSENYPKNIA